MDGPVPRTEGTVLVELVSRVESTALIGIVPRTPHGKHFLGWARPPRPTPEALPSVVSCPPLGVRPWVGSSSRSNNFRGFLHKGHV